MPLQNPPISPMINLAFNIARAKYRALHTDWTNLSGALAGRFNLFLAVMNIQRQGDLDLLLRCMEDEFETNKAAELADTTGANMTLHYQMTLSEIWVVGCYEFMRAFRQRDREAVAAGQRPSGVSELDSFKAIFSDLELLRMPMAKLEIAKDDKLKEPLRLQRIGAAGAEADQIIYDRSDPARSHIMASGPSARGSMTWHALDHQTMTARWIERRDLADRLLALAKEIVPAGILAAQERAAENISDEANSASHVSPDISTRSRRRRRAREP